MVCPTTGGPRGQGSGLINHQLKNSSPETEQKKEKLRDAGMHTSLVPLSWAASEMAMAAAAQDVDYAPNDLLGLLARAEPSVGLLVAPLVGYRSLPKQMFAANTQEGSAPPEEAYILPDRILPSRKPASPSSLPKTSDSHRQ